MITAEIKMGQDYSTHVYGETITEVLEKIRRYHTFTEFEREHYTAKGTLQKELDSGWYIAE